MAAEKTSSAWAMLGLHPVLALLRLLLLSPGKGELCLCHLLRRLDPFPEPVVSGSVCQGERPWRLSVLQPHSCS